MKYVYNIVHHQPQHPGKEVRRRIVCRWLHQTGMHHKFSAENVAKGQRHQRPGGHRESHARAALATTTTAARCEGRSSAKTDEIFASGDESFL
jgi:hypothetical protein